MGPQALAALAMGQPIPPEEVAPVEPISVDPYAASTDFQPLVYDEAGNPIGTPTTMPSQVPPPVYDPATQPVTSTGQAPAAPLKSVSVSTDGYSPDKMAQIQAGPAGAKAGQSADQRIASQVQARYAPAVDAANQAFAADYRATAQTGEAEAQKITAEAMTQGRVQGLHLKHAAKLEQLNQAALIAKHQALEEYKLRLQSIPDVNPNALWDEAGASGQFQMAVAAVVHNMLGVKGIKTTAMDTINQAINNKIKTQIENINKGFRVAQGFKDIYDATVADSATQMEVEAKLQGYYLKAMESGIKAEMGSYDANVAKGKKMMALAEIRKAQAKNLLDVQGHIDTVVNQRVTQQITREGQWLANAREKDRLQLERDKFNAAKDKKDKPTLYVRDPETGKNVLQIVEGLPETIVKDTIEKAGKFYEADKTMLQLREMERKLGPQPDGIVNTRFVGEDARRYQALTKRLAHSMLAAMGERATEPDIQQFLEGLKIDTYLTNGGVSKVLADTHMQMHNQLDGWMLQVTKDVPPEQQTEGPKNQIAPASKIDALKGTQDTPVDKVREITERILNPNSLIGVDEPKDDRIKAAEYKDFTLPYWQDFSSKY